MPRKTKKELNDIDSVGTTTIVSEEFKIDKKSSISSAKSNAIKRRLGKKLSLTSCSLSELSGFSRESTFTSARPIETR